MARSCSWALHLGLFCCVHAISSVQILTVIPVEISIPCLTASGRLFESV